MEMPRSPVCLSVCWNHPPGGLSWSFGLGSATPAGPALGREGCPVDPAGARLPALSPPGEAAAAATAEGPGQTSTAGRAADHSGLGGFSAWRRGERGAGTSSAWRHREAWEGSLVSPTPPLLRAWRCQRRPYSPRQGPRKRRTPHTHHGTATQQPLSTASSWPHRGLGGFLIKSSESLGHGLVRFFHSWA